MNDSYELSKLSPDSFEHLVNSLAVKVLGLGVQTFGPGSDGGRDAFFEGEASYPSEANKWGGVWYIQSKFHRPNLSSDHHAWLVNQVELELAAFTDSSSKRKWPDNWIIATNIDPSGVPETGAFDKIRMLVAQARPELKDRIHIWGGMTILSLLSTHKEVAAIYNHFLTPGHIIAQLLNSFTDSKAQMSDLLSYLIVKCIGIQQYMKLDQAGDKSDLRPAIHNLFVDLPCEARSHGFENDALVTLVKSSCQTHAPLRNKVLEMGSAWKNWNNYPSRCKTWLIKGGPGQGKSTIGQYLCQINRAALIDANNFEIPIDAKVTELTMDIKARAEASGFWPIVPRIPMHIELKEYAYWFSQQLESEPKGILTYMSRLLKKHVEQEVFVGTLRSSLSQHMWLIVFDGLDEVPQDTKDFVAKEIIDFVNRTAVELNCDLLTICTSRPQGYSGQFDDLGGVVVELSPLPVEKALECALPVVKMGRNSEEIEKAQETLKNGINTSTAVQELMVTPLQCHIMAVVVRDGGGVPERKWRLYQNFFQVIKQREINKAFRDQTLTRLLRDDEQLIKSVHNRLGFVLHALGESSKGAPTSLSKSQFRELVSKVAAEQIDVDNKDIVESVMTAATERLILINTPDDGNHFRFDIRPLQEFFAAECIYESIDTSVLRERLEVLCGDSHWTEVMHFLLSALIENGRFTDLAAAVKVLEKLDGVTEDGDRRLKGALGRGAFLASTLLSEGVLDQDKRIRAMLDLSFREVKSTLDKDIIETFSSVVRKSSIEYRNKLICSNFSQEGESTRLGSAVVMTQTLPDSFPELDKYESIVRNSSISFLKVFFEQCFMLAIREDEIPRPLWPLKLGLKILFEENFDSTRVGLIENIVFLLRIRSEETEAAAKELGWPPTLLAVVQLLTQRSIESHEIEMEDFGIVTIDRSKVKWPADILKAVEKTVAEPSKVLPPTSYLKFIWSLFQYVVTRDVKLLKEVEPFISHLEGASERIVPFSISSGLPCQYVDLSEFIKQSLVQASSNDEKNADFGRSSILFRGKPGTSEQWTNLIDKYPETALAVLEMEWESPDGSLDRGGPGLPSTEAGAYLVNKVIGIPSLLAGMPCIWGALINLDQKREGDIRNAILSAVSKNRFKRIRSAGFVSMKINLPDEEIVLPLVMASIFNTSVPTFRFGRSSDPSKGIISSMQNIFPDPSVIIRHTSKIIAAKEMLLAVCLVKLWHPEINAPWSELTKDLISVYYEGAPTWFARGLVASLRWRAVHSDPDVVRFVEQILTLATADLDLRLQLQQVFAAWRQTSISPLKMCTNTSVWPAMV